VSGAIVAARALSRVVSRYRIRSRASLKARGRLLLDAGLFAALVVASNPAWTGIGLHEWLAGLLIVPALYHLAINWDWVIRVSSKVLAKLKATSRINLAVDIVLFFATVAVMLSGFMVIPGVISTDGGTIVLSVWQQAHRVASNVTVISMVIHLLLHAGWIYDAARRSAAPAGRHSASRPGAFAHSRARR